MHGIFYSGSTKFISIHVIQGGKSKDINIYSGQSIHCSGDRWCATLESHRTVKYVRRQSEVVRTPERQMINYEF